MKTLHVLLEGRDDERFFEKVFGAKLSKYRIKPYFYTTQSPDSNKRYIESLNRDGSPYIVLADSDSPHTCFGKSKENLKHRIPNADESRIAIVRTEIESWYLAGIGNAAARKLGFRYKSSTDDITKEEFDALKPAKFKFRSDFMIEALKVFDVKTAKSQNESFRYVWNKFVFPGRL